MLTPFVSDVVEFLKTALDKVFVGVLYGAGGLLGVHLGGVVLQYIFK